MTLEALLGFDGELQIADIGAAAIAETPPYRVLMDKGLARLNAFDADERQHAKMREVFGERLSLFTDIVGDGAPATLYLAYPESGMSSLLKPSEAHLGFFNGFPAFGKVYDTLEVQTTRLDNVAGLPDLDFLKMDIQGSELPALRGGPRALRDCVAIQLEVSFVPLYSGQPVFGDIDLWMRQNGYLPHMFTHVKRWSVSPIFREGEFRYPYNQLLEADIVYFRDLVNPEGLDDLQLRKLALIAHYVCRSPDIVGRIVMELAARGAIASDAISSYLAIWQEETGKSADLSPW